MTDIEAVLSKGFDFLLTENNHGYIRKPLPSPRDQQIIELVDSVLRMNRGERELVVNCIKSGHVPALRCFSERMASLAVRLGDSAPVKRALVALTLAWRSDPDQRESLMVLAPVYDAATRVDPKGDENFKWASSFAPADIGPVFETFLRRPDLSGVLQAMGYVADYSGEGGFSYKHTW